MHQLTRALARCRIALGRRPWRRRAIVAGLALFAAWTAMGWAARVEVERARWGDTAPTLVADRDIAPGDPISSAVRQLDVPVALIPPSAVDPTDHEGRTTTIARRTIPVGAILTDLDIVDTDRPTALLGPDEVAVAIPERVRSGAQLGDRVMVVSDGFVLIRETIVVAVHDDQIVVAAPEHHAAGVAAAVASPAGVSILRWP